MAVPPYRAMQPAQAPVVPLSYAAAYAGNNQDNRHVGRRQCGTS